MDRLSLLNDLAAFPLSVLPLLCVGVLLLLLRGRTWAFLSSLRCTNRTFLLALVLAAGALAVAFYFLQPRVIPWGGYDGYHPRAVNIIKFGVFGTGVEQSALFPPGYSFLMVPLALVLEESRWVFFLTNVLLLIVASLSLRWMLMRLGASEGLANVFALVFFLYPNRMLSTLVPFSDVPFSLLYTLGFVAMLIGQRQQSAIRFTVLAGVLSGASALVRSNGLLLLLPLLFGLLVSPNVAMKRRLMRMGVLAIVAVAVLMPWTLRNYLLFERIVPISTNAGLNLALGNNPIHPAVGNEPHTILFDNSTLGSPGGSASWDQAEWDSYYAGIGMRFILENPATFAGLAIRRIGLAMAADSYSFGLLETYTNARTVVFTALGEKARDPVLRDIAGSAYGALYVALYVLNNSVYYLLVILAIIGIVRRGAEARWLRAPLLMVVLGVWLTIALTFGVSRFKEPLGALLPLVVCVLASQKRLIVQEGPSGGLLMDRSAG